MYHWSVVPIRDNFEAGKLLTAPDSLLHNPVGSLIEVFPWLALRGRLALGFDLALREHIPIISPTQNQSMALLD